MTTALLIQQNYIWLPGPCHFNVGIFSVQKCLTVKISTLFCWRKQSRQHLLTHSNHGKMALFWSSQTLSRITQLPGIQLQYSKYRLPFDPSLFLKKTEWIRETNKHLPDYNLQELLGYRSTCLRPFYFLISRQEANETIGFRFRPDASCVMFWYSLLSLLLHSYLLLRYSPPQGRETKYIYTRLHHQVNSSREFYTQGLIPSSKVS